MKIVRLTSPLPDGLCLSSPRPQLRNGRQLAFRSRTNLTQNLCSLFFVLLLALLPHLSFLLTSPTVPLLGNRFRSTPIILSEILLFCFPAKALRSRARGYISELLQATCPEESHSSFCCLFSPAEFLAAASNLSSSTATGLDKVAYSMLNYLPRSCMDFLLQIFNFFGFCIPFLPSGRHLPLFPSIKWESLLTLLLPPGLSLSSPAYQSLVNASFHLVCNLIPFSLSTWTVYFRSNSVPFSLHFGCCEQTQTGIPDDPFYYRFLESFRLCAASHPFPQTYFGWPPSLLCLLDSIFPF